MKIPYITDIGYYQWQKLYPGYQWQKLYLGYQWQKLYLGYTQ